MDTTDKSNLVLNGVRVVDWTIRQSGPSATQLLADMGAEVIKVETPQGGDSHRGAIRDSGEWLMLSNDIPFSFEVLNRNKKSITVDLTKEEGRQIVYSLVSKSNAFVQNFRLGVAEKLKMDYKTLRKYNPSLVYANCSGYGPKGKQASQPALDPAIHAASGIMMGIGEADMSPVHIPGAMSDQITGMMMAYAIMLGLFHQVKTGQGQEINVSMLGTMIWAQTNNFLFTLYAKKTRQRHLRSRAPNPLVNYYCCKDGRWILLAHFQPDKYWPGLCRVLGLESLVNDPRFKDLKSREKNSAELVSLLDAAFKGKPLDEWLTIFSSEDLIYSPIKDYWEVANDPQVLENGYLVEFDHPSVGKLKEIGIPVELVQNPGSIREPAPQLGQHTEEVLVDILGYSWEDIEKLRDKGVL